MLIRVDPVGAGSTGARGHRRIHPEMLGYCDRIGYAHVVDDALVFVIQRSALPRVSSGRVRVRAAAAEFVARVLGREPEGPVEGRRPSPGLNVSVLRLRVGEPR